METSIIIAKIIGPMLLVAGIGVLGNIEHYRRLVREFGSSPFQIYVSGLLALLLGLVVLAFHNAWEWSWPVIITVIGWASVLKGVVRIVAPGFVATMIERYARDLNAIAVSGASALVLGAVLTYFGYGT